MNRLLRHCALALTFASAGVVGAWAAERSALVDFGKLTPAANCEFVEVNVTGPLLKFAATCAAKQEPLVAEMLRGLKHVRVNVIGLDESNRAVTTERVTTIRKDLTEQGWSQIVTARGNNAEDVVVFAKIANDETIDGLVVTVLEGTKHAVLVNVVGQLKAEQIALLAERLNIPALKYAADAAAQGGKNSGMGPATPSAP
jgi:hypothetical protein